MPRFHFNVFDGGTDSDHDGTELPDVSAARRIALRFAGEILDDHAHRDALGKDWHMEVTDSVGLILFRFDFQVTEAPALRGGSDAGSGRLA